MSLHFSFSLSRAQFNLEMNLSTSNNFIAVMGQSGGGKSSLLRCIAGLERLAEGYCYFRDQCWQDSSGKYVLPVHQRPLGYVSQDVHLFPHLTVTQNLEFGYNRISSDKRIIRVDQAISWFSLSNLLNRDIKKLSGGERQRIAIARAILKSPTLLLMDEPFSAFDQASKGQIVNGIQEYHSLTHATIIYVTHTEDAFFSGQQKLVVHRGRIA